MATTDQTLETLERDSWAFALALYGQPNVPEACLQLQAEADVDVMMMIAIIYAVVRHRIPFEMTDVQAFDAVCRPWREQVVKPLRAVRVALKAGPPPAPSPASEPLRNQIKGSELAAERLENSLLCQVLQARLALSTSEVTARNVTAADIVAVLNHVVMAAGSGKGRDAVNSHQSRVDLIANAACQLRA